jgi:hypothetical protein
MFEMFWFIETICFIFALVKQLTMKQKYAN